MERTFFENFIVRVPLEREDFFIRLMSELGFELVVPELPKQQVFEITANDENQKEQTPREDLTEAENDIQNGLYLFSEEVKNLVEKWKKSV
jgi:hypothetical protein